MNHHPALSLPTQAWILIHTGMTQFYWTLDTGPDAALSSQWTLDDIRDNQAPCHQRYLNHHCSKFCRILK